MGVVAERLLAALLELARNRWMDVCAVLAPSASREIGTNLFGMEKLAFIALGALGKIGTFWLLFLLNSLIHGNVKSSAANDRIYVHRLVMASPSIVALG